jgi:hypothetical protein
MTPTLNTPKILKIIFVVTTAVLAIIWWVNGMENTWFYISNICVVLAVVWASYPKKDKGQ